ncbi:MAG TPA: phosphopantetheine-binding protein [Blastocatellia bacterium]|nr:phosphopantetheine-binding protein [Blastocatellia bacterium]
MTRDDSIKIEENLNLPGDHELSEALPSTPVCAFQAGASRVREYGAPRNEVEAGVAEILAGLLAVERVGIHDNFILLGGESLLAAQAAWQIQNRFGCEVSLRSILIGTVADVAAEIAAAS